MKIVEPECFCVFHCCNGLYNIIGRFDGLYKVEIFRTLASDLLDVLWCTQIDRFKKAPYIRKRPIIWRNRTLWSVLKWIFVVLVEMWSSCFLSFILLISTSMHEVLRFVSPSSFRFKKMLNPEAQACSCKHPTVIYI